MATEAATALKVRVEGMDCGACAVKIENGLKRLPGVSDINVNIGLETLSLALDEDRTSRKAIEERIRALGYTPRPVSGEASRAPTPRMPGRNRRSTWWRTRKGQLVLGTGAFLALAFGVATIAPNLAEWAYVAAALLGLVPIARRAVAGARHGAPFSIETLMTVAAIGAIAIGEGAEAAVVVFLFAVGRASGKRRRRPRTRRDQGADQSRAARRAPRTGRGGAGGAGRAARHR